MSGNKLTGIFAAPRRKPYHSATLSIYEGRANINYNLFVVQKCSAVRWK